MEILSAMMRVTGGIAIMLMAAHLCGPSSRWSATASPSSTRSTASRVVVWAIWLVPYITGMLSAMLPR